MSIKIHSFQCGPMNNMSYIIADEVSKLAVIIDPTWEVDRLIQFITDHTLQPEAIWLTHTHYDHIQGLSQCETAFNAIPVFVHKEEIDVIDVSNPREIHDGQLLSLGQSSWQVYHTPGHSPGGCCFYFSPHLIAGDTIFIDGCGRADMPGSDANALYDSLVRIKQLPRDTIIYPGHHYALKKTDNLENQVKSNRFLKSKSKAEFIQLRMG